MKLLFISDIHGFKTNLDVITKIIKNKNIDKIVILGDILSSGYKNENYDINEVIKFIELNKEKIIAVRGNCDTDQDINYLKVNINKEIDVIDVNDIKIYITHGHIYNEANWNKNNSILVQGHTHKPFIRIHKSNIFLNPGSISLPRGIFKESYMIYENKKFTIFDVDGKEIDSLSL